MNANEIESHIALAAARTAHAHQTIIEQLDFCIAGMKSDAEIQSFLFDLVLAQNDLTDAMAEIAQIKLLYRNAKP